MKIVIDTNVVVSAVFFGGHPRTLIERFFKGDFSAFVSPAIVQEYVETYVEVHRKYSDKGNPTFLQKIIETLKLRHKRRCWSGASVGKRAANKIPLTFSQKRGILDTRRNAMRCITKEMLDARESADSTYNYILRTPKPDFTELDKECEELKTWITEEHRKDREIMTEALRANGRL